MGYGLLSGLLWGLDTVLLGIVLNMSPYISSDVAIFLAPFISTFLHDLFSSIWMVLYLCFHKNLKNTVLAAHTKSGKYIILGALLGGPIGMSSYLLAIQYMGPANTAIISGLYPAIGAFLSFLFLKERMTIRNVLGLCLSIIGVIILGYSSDNVGNNLILGIIFGLICVLGWGSEAVICGYGMKDNEISPEQSLQVRQLTSAIVYGLIIIPLIRGISFTFNVLDTKSTLLILITALAGTASYLCYYKGINKIGATRAMALNITYSIWSIIFGVLLLGSSIDFKSILCCILIAVGSILTAGNLSELKIPFVKKYY